MYIHTVGDVQLWSKSWPVNLSLTVDLSHLVTYSAEDFKQSKVQIIHITFSFSVSLSHQEPARRPKPLEQGVIIFTN